MKYLAANLSDKSSLLIENMVNSSLGYIKKMKGTFTKIE